MSENLQPLFSIEKIYVKDISLEIPHAPQVFLEREQPEMQIELHQTGKEVEGGGFEAAVNVVLTAKLGDKTLFLADITQAGIFQIRNVPQEEIEPILAIACPNILFPYVRETVSDIVSRAGFPQVLLAPVNFESIYHQRLAQAQQTQPAEVSVQ